MHRLLSILSAALACLLVPLAAAANCLPIVQNQPRVIPARFESATVAKGRVSLTFLGHASWLIETPGGVTAVTDYNGWIKPQRLPDIVTMNRAHSSHYTESPEPEIKHVLRGWRDDGGMAQHFLKLGDMRVRNIPTNIRSYSGTIRNGNSIFVFEAGDLCVAHLGHLHHTLTETHLTELGAVDIVLAPVDGGYTIDQEGMIEILQQIKAPLIMPMHFFSNSTLARFLAEASKHYAIEHHPSPSIVLSRDDLPKTPTVRVLPGF
jgi:L-ascorbate metabolism protein UlaG (beta-lactamase superfamily)